MATGFSANHLNAVPLAPSLWTRSNPLPVHSSLLSLDRLGFALISQSSQPPDRASQRGNEEDNNDRGKAFHKQIVRSRCQRLQQPPGPHVQ